VVALPVRMSYRNLQPNVAEGRKTVADEASIGSRTSRVFSFRCVDPLPVTQLVAAP